MKIIHRYLLGQIIRNLAMCLIMLTLLFLIFDFFDRIDNILPEDASMFLVIQYFLFKIPQIVVLMTPVAMLVTTLLTIGILSKNSEITAMRATGLTIFWIARPLFAVGLILSLAVIFMNETLVPYAARRVKEIYNIDIRQKDKKGTYSQSDVWWRSGDDFYSVNMFDSRTNTLYDLSIFEFNKKFDLAQRTNAKRAKWVDSDLGWSMYQVERYTFGNKTAPDLKSFDALPLTISESPKDFYDVKTDAEVMSFLQMRSFIKKQAANGLPVEGYKADLYEKITFPFVTLIGALVVLPFALKPARSGSMAASTIAGLVIGFSYHAVHSLSIAMGRAEIWPPLLAASVAPLLMGLVGVVLNLGAESPDSAR